MSARTHKLAKTLAWLGWTALVFASAALVYLVLVVAGR